MLTWDSDSEGYYATVIDEAGAMRFRLIAEPVGGRWGWTVLGPGIIPRYGDADTLQEAMKAAERAAK